MKLIFAAPKLLKSHSFRLVPKDLNFAQNEGTLANHDAQRKTACANLPLERERLSGSSVVKLRLLSSGDARAYCDDGSTYLIDPIPVLLAEARNQNS